MRTLVKGLIVMMAISGFAFMGCDNPANGNGGGTGNGGTTNGGGNEQRVVAPEFRGLYKSTVYDDNTWEPAFVLFIRFSENTAYFWREDLEGNQIGATITLVNVFTETSEEILVTLFNGVPLGFQGPEDAYFQIGHMWLGADFIINSPPHPQLGIHEFGGAYSGPY